MIPVKKTLVFKNPTQDEVKHIHSQLNKVSDEGFVIESVSEKQHRDAVYLEVVYVHQHHLHIFEV